MTALDRITVRPGLMDGKPCIRGMRVTVSMIIKQLAAGQTVESLLSDFPYLEDEDIRQSLHYAAILADEREVVIG